MEKENRLNSISVKDLAALNLPDFCPRCFWIERHIWPFPRIPFPGIFLVLDAVGKKSIYRYFEKKKKLPDWLKIKDVVDVKIGTGDRLKFKVFHKRTGWYLTGQPDLIFELKNKTFQILDLKTARYTQKQDEFLPQYRAQLNGYAYLAPYFGIKPISKLSLVYCEPMGELRDDNVFDLGFKTKIIDIKINTKIIPQLLEKAREIVDKKEPPKARPNCKGVCSWVERIKKDYGKIF
jgi:hypothetical protein